MPLKALKSSVDAAIAIGTTVFKNIKGDLPIAQYFKDYFDYLGDVPFLRNLYLP